MDRVFDWTPLRSAFATVVCVPCVVVVAGGAWTVAGRELPTWLVVPVIGVAFLVVARMASRSRSGQGHRRFASWRRVDGVVATLLVSLVLFRVPTGHFGLACVLVGAVALGMAIARAFARRAPGPALVVVPLIALAFALSAPRLLWASVTAGLGRTHDVSIDHRMKPNTSETNGDGIRFRGEASGLSDEDFVVLLLGDSFTFGWNLPYESTYPFVFEALANELSCDARVRAVNFGWVSSSPLLSLRLLRDIGQRYRPDLVVYNLDMTDFHDDLRYEVGLRRAGAFEPDPALLVFRALRRVAPALFDGSVETGWRALRRGAAEPWHPDPFPGPRDRYFVTAHPLERTRGAIERGSIRHLIAMHAYTRDVLGAAMALVVPPRAYQYSRRESPTSWEDERTGRLGPYALEPFRYFAEVGDALPFPVYPLLEDFRQARTFPLFFADDPHWNAKGAAFAAARVLDALARDGRLPCRPRR